MKKQIRLHYELFDLIKKKENDIISFFKTYKQLHNSKSKFIAFKIERLYSVLIYIIVNQQFKVGLSTEIITTQCKIPHKLQTKLYLDILIDFLKIVEKRKSNSKKNSAYIYEVIYNYNDIDNKVKLNYDNKSLERHSSYYNFLTLDQEYNNLYKQITDMSKETITQLKENQKKLLRNILELNKNKKEILKQQNKIIRLQNFIENYNDREFNIKQSTVNDRISSIFTNIDKTFREYILIDGHKTIGIDLINSQPVIFANYLINNNIEQLEDIKLFIEISIDGTFYDYLAEKLFEKNRDKAKKMWMYGAYGDKTIIQTSGDELIRYNTGSKLIRELFPNVIEIIDKYKKTSYKDFAIFLQKEEAKHVNKLSEILTQNKINNITIYDEFIVGVNNLDKAIEIITEYLKENNLQIKLKTK